MDRITRIAKNYFTNVFFITNRMGEIKWQI